MDASSEGQDSRRATKLSLELQSLESFCRREALTIEDIVLELRVRTHATFALFLSLPFLQPIVLPGLSSVLGLLIALIGLALVLNRPPWLPRRIRRRKVKLHVMANILKRVTPYLKKLEKVLRPRGWFSHYIHFFRIGHGLLFIAAGLFLALPLPPGGNFPPALVVAFLSLGMIEEDDLFILLAYMVAMGGSALLYLTFDLIWSQVLSLIHSLGVYL